MGRNNGKDQPALSAIRRRRRRQFPTCSIRLAKSTPTACHSIFFATIRQNITLVNHTQPVALRRRRRRHRRRHLRHHLNHRRPLNLHLRRLPLRHVHLAPRHRRRGLPSSCVKSSSLTMESPPESLSTSGRLPHPTICGLTCKCHLVRTRIVIHQTLMA